MEKAGSAKQHQQQSDEEEKDDKQKATCLVCDEKATLRCTACKVTKYCSRDCQRSDWPAHKRACKKGVLGFRIDRKSGFRMPEMYIDDHDRRYNELACLAQASSLGVSSPGGVHLRTYRYR